MSLENEPSQFDKIVISIAILAGIIAVFKEGFVAGILKFIMIIVVFYTAKGLLKWISDE